MKNGISCAFVALLSTYLAIAIPQNAASQVTPSHPSKTTTSKTTTSKTSSKTHKLRGEITSLGNGSITVGRMTFKVSDSVRVRAGKEHLSLSDLENGDEVEVYYSNDTVTELIVVGPCKRFPKLPQCK